MRLNYHRSAPLVDPTIRFWAKVLPVLTGCWEWQGTTNTGGYGIFSTPTGPRTRVHRFAYDLCVGQIPDGLLVLHSCDNPICVRPEHLRVGTNADNARDKTLRKRGRNQNSGATHCKRGHPLEAGNLYISNGYRNCRRCSLDAQKARWLRVRPVTP